MLNCFSVYVQTKTEPNSLPKRIIGIDFGGAARAHAPQNWGTQVHLWIFTTFPPNFGLLLQYFRQVYASEKNAWPKIGRTYMTLSLATVLSLSQDPLHGTVFPSKSRTHHHWGPLNPTSKPIFLNCRITALTFWTRVQRPFLRPRMCYSAIETVSLLLLLLIRKKYTS